MEKVVAGWWRGDYMSRPIALEQWSKQEKAMSPFHASTAIGLTGVSCLFMCLSLSDPCYCYPPPALSSFKFAQEGQLILDDNWPYHIDWINLDFFFFPQYFQPQFVRIDQEKQLPRVQSQPDPALCLLADPVPPAPPPGEYHPLRPQTGSYME